MSALSPAARALLRDNARGFEAAEEILPSTWVQRNFMLSASTGRAGPFDPYPFQTAWLNCMCLPGPSVLTLRKGARVGYTACLTAAMAYKLAVQRRQVLVLLPRDEDADGFSEQDVDGALESSEAFADALAGKTTHKGNRKGYKRFRGGNQLYIRGGQTKNNYYKITVQDVIYDELDAFPRDVQGLGSPITLGDGRMGVSFRTKSIRGSTPRDDGGLMAESEASADVVLGYHVPCPHCGYEAELEYFGTIETRLPRAGWVFEKGLTWRRGEPESVCYVCESCGESFGQEYLMGLLHEGQWRTADGDFALNDLGTAPVGGAEWPYHIAFFCWQIYAINKPWSTIARDRDNCEIMPSNRKVFANETLGRYWKTDVINLTVESLMARAEDYDRNPVRPLPAGPHHDVPKEVRLVSYGMDVQRNRVEIEFVGWGRGEECWALDYRVLPGDTSSPAFWASDELKRFVFGANEDGELYYRDLPMIGVIDASYNTNQVYEFCAEYLAYSVYPGKGLSDSWGKEIAPIRPPQWRKDIGARLLNIGVTAVKDHVYETAMLPPGVQGACHFRKGHGYTEDWYQMFLAEEREELKSNANRWKYVLKAGVRRNEALDCRCYAVAAMKMKWAHGVDLEPERE